MGNIYSRMADYILSRIGMRPQKRSYHGNYDYDVMNDDVRSRKSARKVVSAADVIIRKNSAEEIKFVVCFKFFYIMFKPVLDYIKRSL